MSTVTLPLSLLQTRSADSFKAHKKQEAERQKAQPQLSEAVALRDRIDGWCQHAAKYDNELEDFAAHKKGLVVIDNLSAPTADDRFNRLSGELSIDLASRQKSRAKLTTSARQGEADDIQMSYTKKANKETYTETSNGEVTRLIIDHDKGTLTYTEPGQ